MGAARRASAIGLSGECGFGAATTPQRTKRAAEAIDRLLIVLRIVETPVPVEALAPSPPMRLLPLAHDSQTIHATPRGWFEPAVSLGGGVRAGQVTGWLHDLERLEEEEQPLRFAEDGIVLSLRLHTHREAGDSLAQTAEEISE